MEVGGLGRDTRVDQHLCCLDAIRLGADPINPIAKTGKHLTADFPAIQFDRWVRCARAGHCGADLVDDITRHTPRMPRDGKGRKMIRFVAFLRGINVGGHRKVPMADLRAVCPGTQVESYIASGNLIFAATGTAEEHSDVLMDRIKATFGFEVPVLVLAEKDIRAVLTDCPFPRDAGKLVHAFLCYDTPEVDQTGVAALKTATEEVAVIGKTVWLHAPDGMGRSKLAAKLERLIGVGATARNLNTIIKMVDLLDARAR